MLLYRMAEQVSEQALEGGDLDPFEDAQEVSSWAREGMSWALREGIVTGRGQGILAPGDSASRAEVAAMLCRFLEKVQIKET